jgi:hypothetical protein
MNSDAFCSFLIFIVTVTLILIGNRAEFEPRKRSALGDSLKQG